MLKLNLKIAWRNLLKNKTYTVLNVFGLAMGLAGFVIILLYINKETGYDKWDPALKRTFMVAANYTENGAQFKGSKIKGLFASTVKKQFPTVEATSIGGLQGSNVNLIVRSNGKVIKEKLLSIAMDTAFMATYPLKTSSGLMSDIYLDKNSIAITKTAAKKLFGDIDPLNKTLDLERGINAPVVKMVVKAIWDDEKQPSYFGFDVIFPTDLSIYGDEFLSRTFSTMIKVREGVNQEQLFKQMEDAYIIELAKYSTKNGDVNYKPSKAEALKILKEKEGITSFKLLIEPVDHLNLGTFYESTAKQTTIYILISLACFLVIISCINYTNLALVMAQARAKEVGVKKVLGAFKSSLVKQFFAETAIQCLIAFLFALIFAELLLPQVNQLLADELTLFSSVDVWKVLIQTIFVLLGIVVLSGAYPAIVLAGFLPVKVLKGNFSTAKHIGSLRKVLVVFQFTTAIALVVSFLVIYAQVKFMKEKDLGLNTNQLMTLGIGKFENRNLNPERFATIKSRLLAINGVEDVTRATEEPINDSGFSDDIIYNNITLNTESRYVDPNYFSVIKARIIQGREFSNQLLATDSVNSIILNETAYNKLGLNSKNIQQVSLKKDDEIEKFNVIGVVKDIQVYGFDQQIVPTVYFAKDFAFHWRRNIILRLNSKHMAKTITDIKNTWLKIEPEEVPYYNFADETFAKMNKSYEVSEQIIFSFGMLTLLISVFGLIGFAAYSARIRIKEIALRRILGASTTSLLQLLNKDFVKLVIIANVLADVLAYIYMQKWFNGFVYRIDMPFELFLGANLITVLLTILTVSLQSINAVKENPVKALKYE